MAAKNEAVKTEAVVDTPAAEEKTAPKKDAGKKAPAKKPAAKKTEIVTEKEEAPKKTPAKKTVKKDVQPDTTVTVQFQGKDIVTAQVVEAAKKAFAEANPDVEIKTIDVYVKPDENVAYYAVNGEGSGDYKVEL